MNYQRSLAVVAMPLACLGLWLSGTGLLAAAAENPFSTMDTTVRPGNEFFQYANGTWLHATEIPADRSSYGTGQALSEENKKRLSSLIQELAATHPAPRSEARKIADYYSSFMDEARIEARGLTVLKPTLDRIEAIKTHADLARFLGSTLRTDVDILNATNLYTDNLFGLWVAQDLDDPTRYTPFILQGGLGMPDRDYYLSDAPDMVAFREKYRAHIATVLSSLGVAASAAPAAVFDLELRIARTHLSRTDSEDVKRGDNHCSRDDFAAKAPGLDWAIFFKAAALASQTTFIAWQPQTLTGIAALTTAVPLQTWKHYLKFHALEHVAAYLPKSTVAENFEFYQHVLEGTPQMKERWKRGVEQTNLALGDAVGQLYVQRYFPPQAKATIEELVRHLLAAFSARLDTLTWMSPSTRQEAKAKLAVLKVGVGYPEHWRDYSALRILPGDAFGNAARYEQFNTQRNLAKLGKPIDRSEWVMVPQIVNAVNLPALNALNFPAGILQPPYFDPQRPAALNYGSVGAIIGHEISHSFDDQGALFDSTGRLHNWWTAQDLAQFHASSKKLAEQFSAYRPFADLSVNGQQTLSENIADLGGLVAAYTAYHDSLGGKSAAVIQGFTGDQQFFLSFAQSWREKSRDAALREEIITDGHAPAPYRALTVRNLEEWYRAFEVVPTDALYLQPAERVQIW